MVPAAATAVPPPTRHAVPAAVLPCIVAVTAAPASPHPVPLAAVAAPSPNVPGVGAGGALSVYVSNLSWATTQESLRQHVPRPAAAHS